MKKILVLIIILFLSGCEGSGTPLDINSKDVQNLYKMANPFDDAMVLNLLYKNSESFDNQYILAVAIQNYLNNYNETVLYIPKDDVEKSIFTIFGNNISFYHDKTYLFNNGYCGFDYNQELEQYEMLHGCSGSMEEKFYRKIVDAIQKNDEIIISIILLSLERQESNTNSTTQCYCPTFNQCHSQCTCNVSINHCIPCFYQRHSC